MSAIQQGQQAVVQGAVASELSTPTTNTRSWAGIVAKNALVKVDVYTRANTAAKVDAPAKVGTLTKANTSATVQTPSNANTASNVVNAPAKVNTLPFQRKLNGNQRRKAGRQLNAQASSLASTETAPSGIANVRSKQSQRPRESSSNVITQSELDNRVEHTTPFISVETESQVGASSAGSSDFSVRSRLPLNLVNSHDDPIVSLKTRLHGAVPPQGKMQQESSLQSGNTVHDVTVDTASQSSLQLDNASQENLPENSKSKKKAHNKKKNERRKSKKQAEKLLEEQEAAFLLSAQAAASAATATQALQVNEATLARKSSRKASTEAYTPVQAQSSSFPCPSTFERSCTVHPKGYNFGFSVMDNTQAPRLSSGLSHASSSGSQSPNQQMKFEIPHTSFAPSLAMSAGESIFNAPQPKTADPIHQTGQPAPDEENVPLASNDAQPRASEQRPASMPAAAAPNSGLSSALPEPEGSKPAAPEPGSSAFRENSSTTDSDQDLNQVSIENASPEVSEIPDAPEDDETSGVTAPCKEEAAAAFVGQVEQDEGLPSHRAHDYSFMDGAYPNVSGEYNIRENVLFFLSEQTGVEYPDYMADAHITETSTSDLNQIVDPVEDAFSEEAYDYPFMDGAYPNVSGEYNIRENVLFSLSEQTGVEYPDYMADAHITETSTSDLDQIVDPVEDALSEEAHDHHILEDYDIRKNVLFFLSNEGGVEYPDYRANAQLTDISTSDVDVPPKKAHDHHILEEYDIRKNVLFFLSNEGGVEYPDYMANAQRTETSISDAGKIADAVEDATSTVATTDSPVESASTSDLTQARIISTDDGAIEQRLEDPSPVSNPALLSGELAADAPQPYEYTEDDRVHDPTMPQNRPDTVEELSGAAVLASSAPLSTYSAAQNLQIYEYADDDRVRDPTMPQNRPDTAEELSDAVVLASSAPLSTHSLAQTLQIYEYADDDRVHDPTMPQNRPDKSEEISDVDVPTRLALPLECLSAQALHLYEFAEDDRTYDPTMPQNRPDSTERVGGGATPNFAANTIVSPPPDNVSDIKDEKGQEYIGKALWAAAEDEARLRHARNTSAVSTVSTSSLEELKSITSVTSMNTDPEGPSSDPAQDLKVDAEASPLSFPSPPARTNEASSSSRVNSSTCLTNGDRTQSGRNQSAAVILYDSGMASNPLRRATNSRQSLGLGSPSIQGKGIETRELKRYFGPPPSWLSKHSFKAAKAAATVAIIPADLTIQATLVPVKVAKTGYLVGRWACARFGPRWLQWLVGA
ncbi:hypothetical protein G7Y79_00022g052100 [Physcia stellaris]|nr:hypothetical protein G7Y79_00022g052100 [Physcia stellaris]